jgi:hypothetical protein
MYNYGGWVFDATTIFPKAEKTADMLKRAADFARDNGFLEQDFEDKDRANRTFIDGRPGIRLPMVIRLEHYPEEDFNRMKMCTERVTEMDPYDIEFLDIFFFGSLRGHPSWRSFLQATIRMYEGVKPNYDVLRHVVIRYIKQHHRRKDAGIVVAAYELDPKIERGWDMPELGGLRKLHLRTWGEDGGKEIDAEVLKWLQGACDDSVGADERTTTD